MPFAFDHVDPHRRAVEQQIDHVVVEQVDFVDIEHAAIGRGQHARLKVAFALLDRLFDVERADDAVFGRADRQIDKGGGHVGVGSWPWPQSGRDTRRRRDRAARVTVKAATSTTSSSGSSAARARAAVDLAVPRSPRISTPPICGLMALRMSARFMRSWPTIA
jgi:hypothetical protein